VSCERAVRVNVSLWAASSRPIGKPYQASVRPHRSSNEAFRAMEHLDYTLHLTESHGLAPDTIIVSERLLSFTNWKKSITTRYLNANYDIYIPMRSTHTACGNIN
jgi:hypothetical protein